ncbi:fimbrillin family protein, partial [Bacteroides sp. KG122]
SGNPPYLSYTVPSAVADQKDLLVATAVDKAGNTNTAEPLTMRHALTAVRFVTGDGMLPGTVSKITLKNVYGTGRMKLEASPAWYGQGTTASFGQTLSSEAVAPDPQAPGTPLTKEAETFMMIPQTLPTGAQIEVIYRDDLTGTQRTLTANIAGKTWPMGKTVTYRISTNSIVVTPVLEVTAPAEFTYAGGSKEYRVKSCMKVTRPGDPDKTLPMPWTAEYSTDDGVSWSETKPAWLTTFTASGGGSVAAATYNAAVAAQEDSYVNPHTTALKAAPQKTGWNLANATDGGDAVQNTANCYIVNAPGTYRLPLVYGNAVKNGAANTSAYTSTKSGSNVLTRFINHLGAGITSPYIYENAGCTPDNCTLVWQDEKDLVTGVNLSSDKLFLEFTVDQSTIRQGNAVVAVRDASGTVMWSWHIWVTDYVPGTGLKTITNFQKKQYTIMPFNLGWCDGEEKIYAERTVQIRFKQKPTAGYTPTVTRTFTIKQNAHTDIGIGNNTFFQWGRKDPFVGAILDGRTTKNKTWYDEDGNVKTNQNPPSSSFPAGNTCITSGIQNPGTFCTSVNMDNKYLNLWSADNNAQVVNDSPVVKSIYDPSPVGYKLPPRNAFTGFTKTGNVVSTQSDFNVSGGWDKGWNFYCEPDRTGDTVFFPASGWRQGLSPSNVNNYGLCWSAIPIYSNHGWNLYFNWSQVNPMRSYLRIYGGAVRSIQE